MLMDTPSPSEAAVPTRSPDLATLAALAAIALERRVNGQNAPLQPVHDLATALRRTLTDSRLKNVTSLRASLLDPMTVDLFGRALNSSFNEGLRSVSDIEQHAKEVVDKLFESQGDRARELNLLKDFCLALSQAAQAQSAASRISQPHPYRR
jgi:hypothetical protein